MARNVSMGGIQTLNNQANQGYVDNAGRRELLNISKLATVPEFFTGVENKPNSFDIIPYEIKTKLDPATRNGMNIGEYAIMLNVWVHRGVGPNRSDVLCPKQYNKPCPLCEEEERLRMEGRSLPEGNEISKQAKDIKAKQRSVMWVRPYVDGRPSNTLQLFAVSAYFFTEPLNNLVNTMMNSDQPGTFFNTDNTGSTVTGTPKPSGFGKALEWTGLCFVPRKAEITPEIENQAESLDALLTLLSYDEINAVMNGMDEEEPTPDAPQGSNAYQGTPYEAVVTHVLPEHTQQATPPQDVPQSQPDTEPNITIDFGDGPQNAEPGAVPQDQPTGASCPSGHRFGKDWQRKPQCANCPATSACENY